MAALAAYMGHVNILMRGVAAAGEVFITEGRRS